MPQNPAETIAPTMAAMPLRMRRYHPEYPKADIIAYRNRKTAAGLIAMLARPELVP